MLIFAILLTLYTGILHLDWESRGLLLGNMCRPAKIGLKVLLMFVKEERTQMR